jgi:hypothetical protein
MNKLVQAVSLAIFAAIFAAPAHAATPAPRATPKLVGPNIPKVPLHTEWVVEVNKKGQVVKVESGKTCKDHYFNEHTLGNALQMWIRKPDGSAEVGLYRISYDYEPKTQNVFRNIDFVKAGGNWGDKQGAALGMINDASAQEKAWQEYQARQNKNLPSLDKITGTPSPHP